MKKEKYPDRIGWFVDPLPRFAAGMLMLPPYLFIEGLGYKAILAGFFALLAVAAGKKIRWGYYLILILSVSFFSLLSPWGRVLLEIGPLTITSGALEKGLVRGITLTGMVFLSMAVIRPELKLPGGFGGLLGRTFFYFDIVIEGEKKLSRKNFFSSLDDLLMERFNPDDVGFGIDESASPASEAAVGGNRGWLPAVIALLVPWALWAGSLLN